MRREHLSAGLLGLILLAGIATVVVPLNDVSRTIDSIAETISQQPTRIETTNRRAEGMKTVTWTKPGVSMTWEWDCSEGQLEEARAAWLLLCKGSPPEIKAIAAAAVATTTDPAAPPEKED